MSWSVTNFSNPPASATLQDLPDSLPEKLDIGNGCQVVFQDDTSTIVTYDGVDPVGLNVSDHWHELHDEYMTVFEGKMQIKMDGVWKTYDADPDTKIAILRGTIHALKSIKGVPLKLREETKRYGALVDKPRFKQYFLVDLVQYGIPSALHACRTLVDYDSYAKLPGTPKVISKIFTYSLATLGHLGGSRMITAAV